MNLRKRDRAAKKGSSPVDLGAKRPNWTLSPATFYDRPLRRVQMSPKWPETPRNGNTKANTHYLPLETTTLFC